MKKPGVKRNTAKLLIGLTGGIASGKSYAAARLRELGADIISADELAARELRPGAGAYQAVAARYGESALLPDRSINRKFLAGEVFSSKEVRNWLESLIHPAVLARVWELAAKSRRAVVVADIPLLFETGAQNCFDFTVCIDSPLALRLKRARSRGWTAAEFRRREAAQLPARRKCALADAVLLNASSRKDFDRKLSALFEAFELLRRERRNSKIFRPGGPRAIVCKKKGAK